MAADRVLDETIFHVYGLMNSDPHKPVSADDIVCNPDHRQRFLNCFCFMSAKAYPEEKILRRLLGLRKAKLLPAFAKIKKASEPQ
jgi:hypothetical protein